MKTIGVILLVLCVILMIVGYNLKEKANRREFDGAKTYNEQKSINSAYSTGQGTGQFGYFFIVVGILLVYFFRNTRWDELF